MEETGLELTDRISVTITENADLQASLMEFKDYICREILADSLEFVDETVGTSIEVNDTSLIVNLKKS